jgi:hypothetical protein
MAQDCREEASSGPMQQSREDAASFSPTCTPHSRLVDAYIEADEEPDAINWNEFKMDF